MDNVSDVAEFVDLSSVRIPFIGHSNIFIKNNLSQDSEKLVQSLIFHALTKTFPGQLEVIVYDDFVTGLASPFFSSNLSGQKVVTLIFEEGDLMQKLDQVRLHIQNVQNVIQGRADNLINFRECIGFPVESFKLIIINTDFSLLSEELQNFILKLLRSAPQAGVTFLLHSVLLGVNEHFLDLFDKYSVEVEHDPSWVTVENQIIDNESFISASADISRLLTSKSLKVVEFEKVQPKVRWSDSSVDGISISIGQWGSEVFDFSLGEDGNQRHNALLTGAVGQGKSNLLSVILHTLCLRYSPDELEIYLLDFKEGMLPEILYDKEKPSGLPQIRVLGFDSDRNFALSVINYLFHEYRQRINLFKKHKVQNIKEYRLKFPNDKIPRVLLVMDEFHMLFSDRDGLSREISRLLQNAIRLFRAAGIHLILSSQSLSGCFDHMLDGGQAFLSQIPIRIGLKNSLEESRKLLGFENEAVADLKPREAIVNLNYGELTENCKVNVAFADEKLLSPIRKDLYLECPRVPFIFNGEKEHGIIDDLTDLPKKDASSPSFIIGKPVRVYEDRVFGCFSKVPGKNLAFVGSKLPHAHLVSFLVSLCVLNEKKNMEFHLINFLSGNVEWGGFENQLQEILSYAGANFFVHKSMSAEEFFDSVEKSVKTGSFPDEDSSTFVVCLGMDQCPITEKVLSLCEVGPASGVHSILWWRSPHAFKDSFSFKFNPDKIFEMKAIFTSDLSSLNVFDEIIGATSLSENRFVYWDQADSPDPQLLMPYMAFPSKGDISMYMTSGVS